MKKILLSVIVLLGFSNFSWSQKADTLKVKLIECKSSSEVRFSPDSVIFTINGDTLIINDKRWGGMPHNLIAPRSYSGDTMNITVVNFGLLPADCRLNYFIKIPNAFATGNILNLKFRNV